ncbi:MAG: aspartate--tRNA ligase [Actinobacteria bacterium]|nr:aspartate--tRNA ligase [Actinomycetota bacterium]
MDFSSYVTSFRSNLCGEPDNSLIGQEVKLCGWVNKRRDHGKLIFIDLRDFSGIVQLVFDSKTSVHSYKLAKTIRNEYVITVTGVIRKRSVETINTSIPTGEVEVAVMDMVIFSKSKTPPFMLDHRDSVEENTRLKYRYIDLRSDQMQENLRMRHRITQTVRKYFDSKGFVEIETPILAKSTPEGARDFLVPSRINRGKFYALPQSPQLFKQILMFSGFDRVYQVARCFRDEDLRADRQPEFTQIDLEMSFVSVEDVINVIEGMFKDIFSHVTGKELNIPFKRITWQESMENYGSDKPDLRYGLNIRDISHIFKKSGFRVFSSVLERGGCIKSIIVKDSKRFSRKDLDNMVGIAKGSGAAGLVWIKLDQDMKFQSPVAKFLSDDEIKVLTETLNLEAGDLVLIVADDFLISCQALGVLRTHIADKSGLIKDGEFNFVWVYEFPLFELGSEEGKITPMHHPFTRPDNETLEYIDNDPLKVKSQAYDIILNGQEIGGGSIRINDMKLQKKIFSLLELSEEKIEENFGFFIKAMEYGIPPHGGIALGMDRLTMILLNLKSIREVIAFPKTQSAVSLLSGSPSGVSEKQLREANIRLVDDM